MQVRHEAAIFDLFGTLVSGFWEGHDDHLREVADTLGLPREDFIQAWTGTCGERLVGTIPTIADNLRIILERLGLSPDEERIARAVRVREDFVRSRLIPRPDAAPTLEQLRSRGLSLGLMSDCSPEVPLLWPELSISGYFDCAVFSPVVRVRKPDPRMYLLTCDRLGVNPEACLYIGDGGNNELSGARSLGMTAILISTPCEGTPDPFTSEARNWDGPRITGLMGILDFLG
ncbi:MAG: HAD-IA family hydrolase [candidate division WOR-3 bacterium]